MGFGSMLSLLCMIWFQFIVSQSRMRMDRNEYFQIIDTNVSWTINLNTLSIYIEIIAPISNDNGWVAFGISDTGGMKGADIGLFSLYHKQITNHENNKHEHKHQHEHEDEE
eukprot:175534_1